MLLLEEKKKRQKVVPPLSPCKGGLESSDGLEETNKTQVSSDSESEGKQGNYEEYAQCNNVVVTETPSSISSLGNSEAK